MKKRLVLAIASAWLVISCGTATNHEAQPVPSDTAESAPEPESESPDESGESATQEEPPAEPPSENPDGDDDFAFRLYKRLAAEEQNMFLSPFSLKTALAMVYAGARGNTEKQMAEALGFPLPQEKLHDEMAEVLPALVGKNGVELKTANAIWPAKGFPFSDSFLGLLGDKYQAEVSPLDYTKSKKAIKIINKWTSEKTKKKIKEIVTEEHVNPSTMMVLTNAIYFFGPWEVQFETKRTHPQDFHVSEDKTVEAQMMNRIGEAQLFIDEEVSVLELPYKDPRYSMIVVLPAEKEGLKSLEENLDSRKFEEWAGALKKQRAAISLPKFEIASEFELEKHLIALGMEDAFTKAADFSGMISEEDLGKAGTPNLTDVIQKAVVTVSEEGTEAAAATAAVMKISMPPRFSADHPFMFVIRDKQTGKNLFMGRVVDPS